MKCHCARSVWAPVIGILLVVALQLSFGEVVNAQEVPAKVGLDKMLRLPGTKLVAVEFWADWCDPCQRALPKWRKLHKKYADRGFKLIMVAVTSQNGRCGIPGWVPDKKVCDTDGNLATAMHASDLPQAFLWTWQGTLLLEHADYEEVELAVERWFSDHPRILVEQPVDSEGKALGNADEIRKLIRARLADGGRFELVAFEAELQEIRRLRALGYQANYDENTRCSLGRDVSPNMSLKPVLLGTQGSKTLVLELFSLEKGCLIAASRVAVSKDDENTVGAVLEAAEELHGRLIGKPAAPSEWKGAGGAVREVQRDGETYVPPFGTLSLRSEPEGARVFVNGTPVGRTPIVDVRVPSVKLQIRLVADSYHPEIIDDLLIESGKSLDIQRSLRRREVQTVGEMASPAAQSNSHGSHSKDLAGSLFAKPDKRPRSRWPWVVVGIGGAGFASGIAMLVYGRSLYDDVETNPSSFTWEAARNEWDAADSYIAGGWLTLGLGGAMVVGGTLWGLLRRDSSSAGAVSIVPLGADGVAATFGGTF